jgi:hypothetical protein
VLFLWLSVIYLNVIIVNVWAPLKMPKFKTVENIQRLHHGRSPTIGAHSYPAKLAHFARQNNFYCEVNGASLRLIYKFDCHKWPMPILPRAISKNLKPNLKLFCSYYGFSPRFIQKLLNSKQINCYSHSIA